MFLNFKLFSAMKIEGKEKNKNEDDEEEKKVDERHHSNDVSKKRTMCRG
jgi:hypothetical protein